MKEDVNKLKKAEAIKEVFFTQMVDQHHSIQEEDGLMEGWVDFTNLNKAWPKDTFLVPRIDQLDDATFSHP